jgi:hypothetical protein
MDGVEHAYNFTRDLVVHGGKGTGVDALVGLNEGIMVVVHYTLDGSRPAAQEVDLIGGQGLEVTEGRVTHIDRGRQQITVRYDNGRTEVFRLTEHAAAEASPASEQTPSSGAKVTIYYSDDHGQKVVHFFRRVPK